MEYPNLTHPFCPIDNCKICLKDCENLGEFLEYKTRKGNIDYLGDYRYWLDHVKKIPQAETEFGWFHPDVFGRDNIDGYINYKNKTKPAGTINKGIDWSKKDIYEGIGRPDLRPKPLAVKAGWEEEFDSWYYGQTNKLADSELWKFCRSDRVIQKVRQLLASELARERERIAKEIEGMWRKLKGIITRKFPRGQRKWCIECAKNIAKDILAGIKEMKKKKVTNKK